MNKGDEERLHGIFELINTEKNHIRYAHRALRRKVIIRVIAIDNIATAKRIPPH